MADTRPRHFFGLLCAHKWEIIGTRERQWTYARTESRPLLQCEHCGEIKVV